MGRDPPRSARGGFGAAAAFSAHPLRCSARSAMPGSWRRAMRRWRRRSRCTHARPRGPRHLRVLRGQTRASMRLQAAVLELRPRAPCPRSSTAGGTTPPCTGSSFGRAPSLFRPSCPMSAWRGRSSTCRPTGATVFRRHLADQGVETMLLLRHGAAPSPCRRRARVPARRSAGRRGAVRARSGAADSPASGRRRHRVRRRAGERVLRQLSGHAVPQPGVVEQGRGRGRLNRAFASPPALRAGTAASQTRERGFRIDRPPSVSTVTSVDTFGRSREQARRLDREARGAQREPVLVPLVKPKWPMMARPAGYRPMGAERRCRRRLGCSPARRAGRARCPTARGPAKRSRGRGRAALRRRARPGGERHRRLTGGVNAAVTCVGVRPRSSKSRFTSPTAGETPRWSPRRAPRVGRGRAPRAARPLRGRGTPACRR